ncbi:MAG TPA: TIGR03067 domain-containing protein [Gemmataceae bacterium]
MFVTKMKTGAALVLALTLIAGGTGVLAYPIRAPEADKKEKPKSDQETIQGTWEVVSLTADKGLTAQEAMLLKNAAWIFEKDKFLIKGQIALRVDVNVEGPYKLNPARMPRTIDITMKAPGGKQEQKIEGIYKLNGDDLTLCIPQGQNNRRPTEFKAEEGGKQCLLVFKRKK